MSFLDYLDNLRAKPDRVKTRIAISVSLAITLVIAGVWFVSKYVGTPSGEGTEVVAVEVGSPLSSMTATVSNTFKNLSNEFSNLKEGLAELFSESYRASGE